MAAETELLILGALVQRIALLTHVNAGMQICALKRRQLSASKDDLQSCGTRLYTTPAKV
jgi:hypothetical protein